VGTLQLFDVNGNKLAFGLRDNRPRFTLFLKEDGDSTTQQRVIPFPFNIDVFSLFYNNFVNLVESKVNGNFKVTVKYPRYENGVLADGIDTVGIITVIKEFDLIKISLLHKGTTYIFDIKPNLKYHEFVFEDMSQTSPGIAMARLYLNGLKKLIDSIIERDLNHQ